MKKKIKAALIGFGGMGHHHASEYAAQKDVELVAICDIDKKRLSESSAAINIGASGKIDLSKLRKFLCYEDMVKALPDLDYLDICLPTPLHCQYAIRAMKDGMNVLCEKPMALNLRDCRKMIEVQKKTGKILMIAQCLRFSEEYETIRQAFVSQKYGKLLRLDMRRNANTPPNWFRDGKQSGGAILDLHLHDLDFIISLLGKPQSLTAYGVKGVSGDYDDSIAFYHYGKKGPIVSAEGSWMRAKFCAGAVAIFEKATLELNSDGLTLRQIDKPVTPIKTRGKGARGKMYFNEIAYFAACVKAGKQPERALPSSTCDSVAMVEAERESIRKRKTVKVK